MGVKGIMINKAYKFRIYPNKAQATLINKTIGCSRFVFNHFLSLWNNAYKETGKGLTYGTANKSLSYRKHLLQANYVLVVDIKTKTLKI
ncbi:helix-turn-helix domain-containing protein [Bacillus sp. FSL P2-0099]|uniref:helix-turn-helix domain-containing protein n=1 Tax=Bacillus sp. FSL P2-0099 TaxID=2921572 RepID=UPI004046AFBF